MTTQRLPGGCLCGAIRYETDPPRRVMHCHCAMCRRASGGAFLTWAVVALDGLDFTKGEPRRYRSSDTASRGFCAGCGAQLTFEPTAGGRYIGLTVGSLDDPDAVTPERHIWVASKVSWLRIDDDLPRKDRD